MDFAEDRDVESTKVLRCTLVGALSSSVEELSEAMTDLMCEEHHAPFSELTEQYKFTDAAKTTRDQVVSQLVTVIHGENGAILQTDPDIVTLGQGGGAGFERSAVRVQSFSEVICHLYVKN